MKDIRQSLIDCAFGQSTQLNPLRQQPINFRLLGLCQYHLSPLAEPIDISGRAAELLAYLLLSNRQVHQEKIARDLWPYGGQAARNSLHQTVHQLRKILEQTCGTTKLVRKGQSYGVECGNPMNIDWFAFRKSIGHARSAKKLEERLPHLLDAYRLSQTGQLLEFLDESIEWAIPYISTSNLLQEYVVNALVSIARDEQLPDVVALLLCQSRNAA